MRLVRRSLVLLLAYLASTFVSALAVTILSGFQQSTVVWAAQMKLILPIVLVLGLGVAWLPLGVSLAVALRLVRSRLAAALCAGIFTAFVLIAWQGRLVDAVLSEAVSPMDPPLWRLILQDLPAAVVVGLLGGAVFWAIALRGTGAAGAR